jgi:hypothetical protein
VIFDGCPITQNQKELKGKGFIHHLLEKVYPNITESKANNMVTALMTIITLLAAKRLIA